MGFGCVRATPFFFHLRFHVFHLQSLLLCRFELQLSSTQRRVFAVTLFFPSVLVPDFGQVQSLLCRTRLVGTESATFHFRVGARNFAASPPTDGRISDCSSLFSLAIPTSLSTILF